MLTDDERQSALDALTEEFETRAPDPDRFCKPDQIWVCGACGKVSQRDSYGLQGIRSRGWDESCTLNSVRCERGDIAQDFTGRVTEAKAVQE